MAAQFCGSSSLKRLIWIPKGLKPRDERQASFIRQLQSEPRTVTGAELIADTLENLKVLLRSRWRARQIESEKPRPVTASDGAPRVYLICDQQDEAAVEPLEDFFYARAVEVSLPGFEADESEVQQIHIQNLKDCDAALIYYGAAGMHWVDFKIRDLQKAAGYRDSRPIPKSAVDAAPPFNHRKERFKSVSVDIVRQSGDSFDPAVLESFVKSLRQAKDAQSMASPPIPRSPRFPASARFAVTNTTCSSAARNRPHCAFATPTNKPLPGGGRHLGSGKSSLVRAGMIAELHGGTMTQAGSTWGVIILRPGGNPVENLARAFVDADLYDAQHPVPCPACWPRSTAADSAWSKQ